jgi:hypothetical protein
MFLLYLSGPMTGRPNYHYDAFNAAAADLRSRGHVVDNPAEHFGGDQGLPLAAYMRSDVCSLLCAEAICLLDGWEKSTGARLEARLARALGLSSYLYTPSRPDGLRSVTLTLEVLPA